MAIQYAPAPLLPVGTQAPRAPSSRRNVAALSHAEYVPTLTAAAALRVKAPLSKAALTLTFDLLTLKVVSESHVTRAISVPILVFLGLSVLDLGPMYVTDVRQHHRFMPLPIRGGGIITFTNATCQQH